MVEVLNLLEIEASVYGNHDFDFGVETLVKHASQCNFPWLLSNVYNGATNRPLANGAQYHVTRLGSVKVGVIGLVEEEWLATIENLPSTTQFRDFVTEGRALCATLRQQGCELIVCLAHMRWERNLLLARGVPDIDVILGGHDHFYQTDVVDGTTIICSGVDFRFLSVLQVTVDRTQALSSSRRKPAVRIVKVPIERALPVDPAVEEVVERWQERVERKLEKPIGFCSVRLDARTSSLRAGESNLGNFVADCARAAMGTDLCILNSGTIRSDSQYELGPFTLKTLLTVLPFPDVILALEVSGRQVWQALENGVSQYPALEGRFPQVSGLRFVFDPSRKPGSRVRSVHLTSSAVSGGQLTPLDLDARYSLATKTYLQHGCDGYDCLREHRVLVEEENGKLLPTIVRQHFTKLNVLNGFRRLDNLVRKAAGRARRSAGVIPPVFTVAPACDGRIQAISGSSSPSAVTADPADGSQSGSSLKSLAAVTSALQSLSLAEARTSIRTLELRNAQLEAENATLRLRLQDLESKPK